MIWNNKATWNNVAFGTLVEFRNGLNFTKENFGYGIKVIGVKDFQDYSTPRYEDLEEINPVGVVRDSDLVANEDLLFVRSNGNRELIGRSLYISNLHEATTHSGFTIRARFTSPDALPKYYAYFMKSPLLRSQMSAYGGGTNISNLNQGILGNLSVPLPPLPTQHKIASILSAYDDLIENNTRRIKILEAMAQAIYREWFVHFRFPGYENVPMVDSELGQIPQEWEVKAFSESADFINGFAFKPKHWETVGKPIIKIKELKKGVTKDTPRYHGEDIPKKYHVSNGSLLFSWSGDLDAYIWADGDGLLNQHLFEVIPFEPFKRQFLYFTLRSAMRRFRSLSLGTTMRHIKRSALSQVYFIAPPKLWIQRFDDHVGTLISEKQVLTDKNQNLRKTRDLLLPRLISGRLDVEELEIKGI